MMMRQTRYGHMQPQPRMTGNNAAEMPGQGMQQQGMQQGMQQGTQQGTRQQCCCTTCLGNCPSLAMVYAPVQAFEDLYQPEEALCKGTLFKQLDLPFHGCFRV